MEIRTWRIISKYKLRHDVVNLNNVFLGGFKEYKNHKSDLKEICFSTFEYNKAIKCLKELMEIYK